MCVGRQPLKPDWLSQSSWWYKFINNIYIYIYICMFLATSGGQGRGGKDWARRWNCSSNSVASWLHELNKLCAIAARSTDRCC